MSDAWKKRREAQEEDYFRKQNEEALARLKEREAQEAPRLSPITGEPMEQLTYMGVVIDRCPKSGGVWLDAGELDQIIEAISGSKDDQEGWVESFFAFLKTK